MKFVEDLGFYHFKTSEPGQYLKHCESAFRLWENQWNATFQKSNLSVELYADDFLNRELGGLFLGTQAIGFILYNFFDFSRHAYRKMRYFKNFPPEVSEDHHHREDLVMVPTYMTLDSEWRKSNTNLPLTELIFGFSVLRFLESDADRMIAYARNDVKMSDVLYRHGARSLARDVSVYNTPVDFLEITRQEARLSDLDACAEMTLMFWNKTKSKTNENIRTVFKKKGEKNHVVTLYQQKAGTNAQGHDGRALGEQELLPGLARPDLSLYSLQPAGFGHGSGLVDD